MMEMWRSAEVEEIKDKARHCICKGNICSQWRREENMLSVFSGSALLLFVYLNSVCYGFKGTAKYTGQPSHGTL